MAACIQIKNVWKCYSATPAVRDLSLSVPSQSVYGFLGPNGAGKSTTIRMVLGLQNPDQGEIFLFDRPLKKERIAVLRRTGSLVEFPSLYHHLTGRENLEVYRRYLSLPKSSIEEVLATVDLTSAGHRLVRQYSTGMKQRLGVALALLGDPELLVLDEPTNGLDPAGIHEIRTLVRSLPVQRGVTVFLSSHLLSEIEQVATHLAIISQGRLMFEGTQEQLQQQSQPWITLEVDQPERACALLHRIGTTVIQDGNTIRIASHSGWEPAQINALLVKEGIAVSRLTAQHPTLEDFFLKVTAPPVPAKEYAAP